MDLQQLAMFLHLMQARGGAGMQPSSAVMQALMGQGQGQLRGWGGQPVGQPPANQLANEQAGGMSPQMMQMLQYYLQNQANNLGPQQGGGMQAPQAPSPSFPQGGGGADLGAMMQAFGFPSR